MKYILIILITFTHTCYGQGIRTFNGHRTITFEEADSLSKYSDIHVMVKWDTANHSFMYQVKEPPKIDTVFVIMLVSDTSEQDVDYLGKVYWNFGYEVRETFSSFVSYKNVSVYDFDHINYLDIDKKELPINIIVWQSKQF